MFSNWFLIALAAPFLWGIVNIFDNYLVANFSTKERERSSGGLVLFSSLVGIVIAFLISITTPDLFEIPSIDKILLFITGILTIVWIVFYLFALEIEEVSNVVPWFLTVPIFGYILGYFFLGETLSNKELLGSLTILIGVALVSIDWKNGNRKLKHKPVLYMSIACFLVALSGVIFKYVTIENDFWISSFWEYVGLGVTGILIYLFVPKYRNEFHFMNKEGGKKIFFLNIFSEFLTIAGNLLTNYALLLAPVTLVYLVGSFQPAIVLILAILGTKFLPKLIKEDISKENLKIKFVSMFLMLFGSLLLFI
jgi:uncharacterized membrane protein